MIHCNSQQLKAHWSTLAGTLFTSDKNGANHGAASSMPAHITRLLHSNLAFTLGFNIKTGALVYWDMDKKEEIQHNGPKVKSYTEDICLRD